MCSSPAAKRNRRRGFVSSLRCCNPGELPDELERGFGVVGAVEDEFLGFERSLGVHGQHALVTGVITCSEFARQVEQGKAFSSRSGGSFLSMQIYVRRVCTWLSAPRDSRG